MTQAEEDVHVVDCRGLACPEPVWRLRQAIEARAPGDCMEVWATDPLAELDLGVFCRRTGHQLERAATRDGVLVARIRVRTAPRPGAG
jgi:tRNA 2-thiouridine synthesizing protein A